MNITVTLPGNKSTVAEYKGFTVRTAQPVENGGDGSAPTPFDLFLMSIAGCAGTYAAFFCDQRGIDTSEIKIVQSMKKDPGTNMVTGITIEIVLPPDFPEKYILPLLKSVDLCSVKKHILSPPAFELKIIEP